MIPASFRRIPVFTNPSTVWHTLQKDRCQITGVQVLWVRGQSLFQLRWFLPYNRECHQRYASAFLQASKIDNMLIFCFGQLLSQLTGRIRLYGADCNQTALVVCLNLFFFFLEIKF